jgi:class 3 adenylate cyclase/tetratricopeptide (TPR) repeat protein
MDETTGAPTNDFGAWLTSIGLERYWKQFAESAVDFDVLADLSENDLKELGVSLGDRKRLLRAVTALSDLPSTGFDGTSTAQASMPHEEGERRQVAVLFADLAGYTKLTQTVDAEEVHAALEEFFQRVDGIVVAHGGHVDKHIGDCVMAVFGAPVSYGNDAERAVCAALAINNAIPGSAAPIGHELRVHIGIASGQVLASSTGSTGHREYTVTGDAVNLASRLTNAASPGEVLISEDVHRAVSERFEVQELAAFSAKGFDGQKRRWRVQGFRSGRRRPRPLVGRTMELQQCRSALATCRETGRGSAIYLRGEAGIGKTRLIEEVESLASMEGFTCHRGLVLDFGEGLGGDAIRTLVRDILGISWSAGQEATRTAASLALEQELVSPDSAPFLNDLLDLPQPPDLLALYDAMDNSGRNRGKRRTLARLIERVSGQRPRVLLIEDVHWADPLVLGHLAELTRAVAASPTVMIMTSRLEGDPLDKAWRAQIASAGLTTIDLAPLPEKDARAMAARHISADADLVDRCIERAAGNPLFLEQLLHYAGESDEAGVPASVQSLTQSRLDRLPADDRTGLQAASVLGQRFSGEALRQLLASPEYAPERLVARGLLRPQGEEFLFAHALIRDAVYDGLLKSRRRELHRSAAEWFGNVGDLVLKAEHLDRAESEHASQAYLAAARAQAEEYRYERALQLVQKGTNRAPDDRQLRFALAQLKGDLLRELGSTEASIDAFKEALALAEQPRQTCRAWIGLIAGMRVSDAIDDALELLDLAQQVAEDNALDRELSEIHYYRGSLYFPSGDIEGCIEQHGFALDYAKRAESVQQQALALSGLGDGYYAKGRMRTAYDYFQRCLALCDEHGLGRVEAANRFMIATVRIYMNELDGALQDALASAELAQGVGHHRAEIVSRLTAGWILIDQRDLDGAREQVDRGLELARAVGAKRFEPFLAESSARILMAQGDRKAAADLLEVALEETRALGALTFIGPWLLGSLACATDDVRVRHDALTEGAALLAAQCVGHNYYHFYRNAIEASLAAADWDGAESYAASLEAYAAAEPVPWSDFFVARGRALAAYGRGKRDRQLMDAIEQLRTEAKQVGFKIAFDSIAPETTK